MKLALDRISHRVGAVPYLHPLDLAPHPGALTVLLGATGAGKTTLLRIMAGLDVPTQGRVLVDDVDVTRRPVRERDIAMVYQQFINYPSLTVAENIASPLRRRRVRIPNAEIDAQVRTIATRLRIDPFLGRLPAALSGGQQQRVALARALAKQAPLVLLDEPLVNLDYKLREELREELTRLFATGMSTVVYATTDPSEALLLGGYTAVLGEGALLQYGPTAEVFHQPASLRVARAFSDPPMNLLAAQLVERKLRLAGDVRWPLPTAAGGERAASHAHGGSACTLGLRASALRLHSRDGDVAVHGTVALADIAGSDTFVHVTTTMGPLIAQLPGVHVFALGAPITLHVDPARGLLFDAQGLLRYAPAAGPH